MFKKRLSKFDNQKGQSLLIVVLVMVVALTVGLSIVSRTITNLRTSTEQVNSQKALSAAEAGVEQALKNESNVQGGFSGNTTYTTTVSTASGTMLELNGGNPVAKDDGVYVWLTHYGNDWTPPWNGNLTIYWGSPNDVCSKDQSVNTVSALEVAVITGTKDAPVMTRYAFDSSSCSRSNNFTLVTPSAVQILGRTYNYSVTISNITSGLLVRVIPVYASTFAAVSVDSNSMPLPSQGSVVTSTGTSNNTVRKINVYQGFPELPSELFPYSLFSPENEQ